MLLPQDDYPLHQTPLPVGHVMGGHPNAYDRFWFNGYNEEIYFAVALGLYPNRGVIDGAFSVLLDDKQYSVFASDELVERPTNVGPISIEIIEPLRINRIRVDAPDQGLSCDLIYTQRSATVEEPRQTMHDGPRIFMDVTRATQLGTWRGWIETPEGRIEVTPSTYGTKDRSWGVRPIGEPLPGAPSRRTPQLCFLWAPLNFEQLGVHYMSFNDVDGRSISASAAVMEVGGPHARSVDGTLSLQLESGTRWMKQGNLRIDGSDVQLTPLRRFHMRGAGYSHPNFAHGRWHGGLVVEGEVLHIRDVNPLEYSMIHVQTVVRATSSLGGGLGVVEQLIVGPYEPLVLTGLLDGAP